MGDKTRRKHAGRMAMSILLLTMMAACSYLGAGAQGGEERVSLPVTLISDSGETEGALLPGQGGMSGVQHRLSAQRQEEIKLLEQAAFGADAQTAAYAAGQQAQIAMRMESEALAGAVLEAMGETEYAVCCGAGILTLFLPEGTNADNVSLISTVSEQTGIGAESIKIILVKNET